ncbi:Non-canonical purine NTP pyrophosphatase [compost metagenome]
MNKLLNALKDKSDRSAQFKTVIALNLNGEQHLFTGLAKGEITFGKAGNHGFGYDPIFQPENYSETFAELSSDIKNKISHRAKATKQLIDFLNSTK